MCDPTHWKERFKMGNIKHKMGNKLANLSEHIKELNSPDEMKKRFDAVNKKIVAIGNQMKHNEYNWYLDVNAEENKRID